MGDRRPVGPAEERPLDAAVLEAEGDLEVEDALAVALEAEVPRLDDPAWTGPTATSWTSCPSTRKKSPTAGRIGALPSAPTRRGPGATRPVADRLEPRVPLRLQAELLGHLPLEEVRLRRGGRQRREAVPRHDGRATASVPGRRRRRPPRARPPAPASGAAKNATSRRPRGELPEAAPGDRRTGGRGPESERSAPPFRVRVKTPSSRQRLQARRRPSRRLTRGRGGRGRGRGRAAATRIGAVRARSSLCTGPRRGVPGRPWTAERTSSPSR